MEGGEGSLSRCTAKSAAAAAAAATGPRGPLKRYPAGQRKAKKEAPATGPRGSSKGSSTKRKAAAKDPASRPMPPLTRAARRKKAKDDVSSDATAAMTRAPGEEEEELDKYRRLSKADIRWILTLKPTKPPARFAALKRSNPDLTPQPGEEADEDKRRQYRLAKLFYELEENLPATQKWVRTELKDKGYVELDRETAKNRAEVQAVIDREWPAIEEKMKSLILAEKEYKKEYLARGGGGGGSKSDSDDGEGSDGSDEEEDELYY